MPSFIDDDVPVNAHDDDVLVNAQKLICRLWGKREKFDPLKPSTVNCRAPFFLNLIALYCYGMCVRKWRTLKIKKTKVDIAFVPVWVCDNYSEKKKKNKWKLETLVAKSDEGYAYVKAGVPLNTFFVGTVEMTYVPHIDRCAQIDDGVLIGLEYLCDPLEGSGYGYYVDFEFADYQVLEVKKMCEIQPEFERPTIDVPPMCQKILPAVHTDDLPEALQKLLKKEFDSDCSTYLKRSNWYFDYCAHPCKNFLGISKRPILPPEYQRLPELRWQNKDN